MNIRFGKMIILVALIGLVVTDIDAVRGSGGGGRGGGRGGARSGGGSRGGGGGGARMGGSAGGGRSFSGGSGRVAVGRSTSFVGGRTGGVTRAAGVTRTGGRVAGTGARVAGGGVRTGARVGGARVAGRTFAGRRGIHGGRFGRGWGRRHGYGYRYARWGLLGLGSEFWLAYGYPDYYYQYYRPWTNSCRVVNDTNVDVLVSFGDVERGLQLPAGEILYVPCGSDVIVRSAVGEGVIDLPSVDAETVIGSDDEGFYVY